MTKQIRAAIVARLKSVPGIGQVFNYERYVADDKKLRALYAPKGKLLGWHVRRVGRRENARDNLVETDWEIRGFRGLEDEPSSELEFDDLLDSILDAFREDPTLGRLVLYPQGDDQVVPQILDSGPVMFVGVLCHGAKLRWTTRHVLDADRPWD